MSDTISSVIHSQYTLRDINSKPFTVARIWIESRNLYPMN